MSFVNPTPDSELDAERSARSQPAQVPSKNEAIRSLPDWAKKAIMTVRDLLALRSYDEAYHQLYIAFTPQFCYQPWRAIEGTVCECTTCIGNKPPENETFEQPMLTVRSRGPLGPNDVIVDATELVKHVTFRMSLKISADANAQKALEPRDWVIVCGDSFYGINGAFVMLESNARGFQSCADAQDFAKGMRCPWSVRERSATAQGK